jgi:drug/metabolite transporter (DMT)-like permease
MTEGGNCDDRAGLDAQRWVVPMLSSAAASIITGIALVATRYVVHQTDGLTVATLRYCVATACLLPIAALSYPVAIRRRDMLAIAALGILYFCFFPWSISSAMQFTTASSGAIVLACTPAITLLLAAVWGSESLSARKCSGVLLAILGAAVAIGGTAALLESASWVGQILMILATLAGAAYAVFSKAYLTKYPPVVVTAIAMSAGAGTLLVIWLVRDLPSTGLPDLNSTGWLVILYIGAIGGALSFFLYAWALGRTAPTATMILLPLNPIAAILTGVTFLGEPLNLGLFAGLALVITGIFLVINTKAVTKPAVVVTSKINHEVPPA